MQTSIPCTMMRGGTSRGPYFLANDLPKSPGLRDEVLLAVMGSASGQQIDGIGGANSLTSKAAIVSVSSRPDADIDYLFAQVSVDEMSVDTSPSCGNILAGVAPFAIESGLVNTDAETTTVVIHNVNTNSLIEAVIQTPNGFVEYEGETSIDGVNGTAAPILLNFLDVAGTKTGRLFPTEHLSESINGIQVSCIDAAVPMVLIPAESLGVSGHESKQELDSNTELLANIEAIRLKASVKMGLGDATGKVIPKVSLVSTAQNGGSICSRYFVPQNCHGSHAVTGAIAIASAAMTPGTVAAEYAHFNSNHRVEIEHPSGSISIVLKIHPDGLTTIVKTAGVVRTARPLFSGNIHIPSAIWHQNKSI